jgi:hypothetical protein
MSISAWAALVFMLLILVTGSAVLVRRARAGRGRTLPFLAAFVITGGAMVAALAWRLSGEAGRSDLLALLKASDVAAVTVGTQRLASSDVARLVTALNECRPLSDEGAHRSLTTARIRLRLELRGGELMAFSARYEPKTRAALLAFETWTGRGESPGSSVGGDLRCAALPEALAAAGAPLPGFPPP